MKEPKYKIEGEFTLDALIRLQWVIEGNPLSTHPHPPYDVPKVLRKAIKSSLKKAIKHHDDWTRENFKCAGKL